MLNKSLSFINYFVVLQFLFMYFTGVVGAENGTLTFMVGGDESALNAAKYLFQSMGSRWVYCGPAGSGLIAKICNNMILGMTMVAVAESMNLGIKYGIHYIICKS